LAKNSSAAGESTANARSKLPSAALRRISERSIAE